MVSKLAVTLLYGFLSLMEFLLYVRVADPTRAEGLDLFLGGEFGHTAGHFLRLLHDLIVVHPLGCQGFSQGLLHFGLFR